MFSLETQDPRGPPTSETGLPTNAEGCRGNIEQGTS